MNIAICGVQKEPSERDKLYNKFLKLCHNGCIAARLADYRLNPDGEFTEGKWGQRLSIKGCLKTSSASDLRSWGLTEEVLHIIGDEDAQS
jgi:hypothetical protein